MLVYQYYYNYKMSIEWMLYPYAILLQVGIIIILQTNEWAILRKKIRKFFFSTLPSGYSLFTVNPKDSSPVTENTCPICLNNSSSNEYIKTPCGHVYHLFCLSEWMKESHDCPTCRRELPAIDAD